jgi:hypothetical protein
MAKSLIPLRPEGFSSSLTQAQQAALTWYVLSGCAKRDAFVIFARPDMMDKMAKAAVEDYARQFFSTKEAKDYLDAYRKTLDDFLHPAVKPVAAHTASLEERKAKAKTKAMEFAMSLADNIEQAEDPETVLKLMDKVGLLDGDEEVEEQPRRYLPVSCSGCEYRKFVEENCERVEDGTDIEGKTE